MNTIPKLDPTSELLSKLDPFTDAYITCALWSSNDESDESGGVPLDSNYGASDIAPEALQTMIRECLDFQEANAELLAQAGNDEQNGHDFWLTRNGHGAGFWDRGYPKAVSDPLCTAAHAYGDCNLFVNDDGRIYIL